MPTIALDFPVWLRATHLLNILFLSLLIRSGLEILSAHPKLYWNDNTRTDNAWLKFTKRQMPKDELWTSRDEQEAFSSWLALPGHRNLGLGRQWHFAALIGWILTGLVYVILLFTADEWQRLVPTSWSIFPQAWSDLLSYLSFNIVQTSGYNALQQLSYFGVVFLLTPLTIATGAAMSPAVAARFPWYTKIFHGRQGARSLHFLCLLAFTIFVIIHVLMVVLHGLPQELAKMVFGSEQANQGLAVIIAVIALLFIVLIHIVGTAGSLRAPRRWQHLLQPISEPLWRVLFHHEISKQHYRADQVSSFLRVNGRPPNDARYQAMADKGFADWRLEVSGLVAQPLSLSLDEIKAMPRQEQTTKHVCIQGWSGIAEWAGVPLSYIVAQCQPRPEARYLVFHALDDKAKSEPEPDGAGCYYETIDLELANHPQTMLAYAMNGETLPVAHGAPLRLRVETQLGFKMVKYLRAIEFVADYRAVGEGQGGWREDNEHYAQEAGI